MCTHAVSSGYGWRYAAQSTLALEWIGLKRGEGAVDAGASSERFGYFILDFLVCVLVVDVIPQF